MTSTDKDAARREIERRVDALVKAGKVPPDQRDTNVDFSLALDADGASAIEFRTDGRTEKVTAREFYLRTLERGRGPNTADAINARLMHQVATAGMR